MNEDKDIEREAYERWLESKNTLYIEPVFSIMDSGVYYSISEKFQRHCIDIFINLN